MSHSSDANYGLVQVDNAPGSQVMSLAGTIDPPKARRDVVDDDWNKCCPSALSCFVSTICPCVWCGCCVQVDYNTEAVFLNYGSFTGVLRKPGLHCPVNLAGMERINVNIAVQSIEIAKVKVVDVKGNPLIVSGVVTFQIIDTKKAALDVRQWQSYLNTQAEVVLKQICSSHPYESRVAGEDSLKTEASKVRREIVQLLQAKVTLAGVHIMNFEFKELSYAPEIAASMLVRQQAEAMLEARQVVVEGGVRIAYEAIQHLRSAGLEIGDGEASRLAANLVLTICSESRITPTIQLGGN